MKESPISCLLLSDASSTQRTKLSQRSRSPSPAGACSRRHEGQIVFVAGAIPGERARVRIDRIQKQLAFAKRRRRPRSEPRSKSGRCRLGVRRIAVCAHRVRAAAPAEVGSDRRRICAHRQNAARRGGRRACVAGKRAIACGPGFTRDMGSSDFSVKARTISATRRQRDSCCPTPSMRCGGSRAPCTTSRSRRASFPRTPPRPSGRCCSNWRRRPADLTSSIRLMAFLGCCSSIINRGT